MYQLFFHGETKLKKRYWFFLVFLILCDGLSALTPVLLGYLVEYGLNRGALSFLIGFGVLVIAFVVLRTLGSYLNMIQLDYSSFQIYQHRKKELYQKVHTFDFSFFREFHVGELLNVIDNDVDNIRSWFAYHIKTQVFSWIHFLIALVFFVRTSLAMTLFLVGFILLQTIYIFHTYKRFRPYYLKMREENANFSRQIQDFIDGSRVLKSFQATKEESSFLQRENARIKNIDVELSNKRNTFYHINYFLSYFLSIVFLIFIIVLFFKGKTSIGEIIILNSLLGYLQEPFMNMDNALDAYERAKVSEKRLKKLYSYQTKIIDEKKKNVRTLYEPISFQNVSLLLDGKEVLKNINLVINPGKTIAFIGLTGSGKSSIANLLERFYNPSSGTITLGNEPLSDYDLKSYRDNIGYVFQEPFLFSDTISNNIFFGAKYSKKVLNNLIHTCRLEFVLDLPKKFETVVGEKGVGLSGGEKQRIALARALARQPELLILDDMTSSLDIETEESITKCIYEMKETLTKVIIAEKIVSVKNADMIYVMKDGEIIESGSHQALLKKKGYYYEMDVAQRREK